jgi:hypothetical protein
MGKACTCHTGKIRERKELVMMTMLAEELEVKPVSTTE